MSKDTSQSDQQIKDPTSSTYSTINENKQDSDKQPSSKLLPPKKKRKTVKKQGQKDGRWTAEEHKAFLDGLEQYGRDWKKVEEKIPTRSSAQIRSHAHKYFSKISKSNEPNTINEIKRCTLSSSALGISCTYNPPFSQPTSSLEKVLLGLSKSTSSNPKEANEVNGANLTVTHIPYLINNNFYDNVKIITPTMESKIPSELQSSIPSTAKQEVSSLIDEQSDKEDFELNDTDNNVKSNDLKKAKETDLSDIEEETIIFSLNEDTYTSNADNIGSRSYLPTFNGLMSSFKTSEQVSKFQNFKFQTTQTNHYTFLHRSHDPNGICDARAREIFPPRNLTHLGQKRESISSLDESTFSSCDASKKNKIQKQKVLNEDYLISDSISTAKENTNKKKDALEKDSLNPSKWKACTNPWGKPAQENHDILLVAPPNEVTNLDSKRFTMYPFHSSSIYMKYNNYYDRKILSMKKDTMQNWGFEFEYDNIGGACCVTSVISSSPAEAAIDVGTGPNNNKAWSFESYIFNGTTTTSKSMMQVGDIILCINGKHAGGMTKNELYEYIKTACGDEIIIALARKTLKQEQNKLKKSYSDKISSNILIANADDSDSEENEKKKNSDCTKKSKKCICGKIHSTKAKSKSNMFWIDCIICGMWYKVNKDCVGMSFKDASSMDWTCIICSELSSESSIGGCSDSYYED